MRYSAFNAAIGLFSSAAIVAGQTYTDCNPLTATCPADPALQGSVTFDFTQGSSASSDFLVTGTPTYDANGIGFTVAKQGDAPLIQSKWYIMFGKVEYVIKAAPGTGIVSSAVLQSDDLDEIDWEWLGGDDTQVQTNYFGKGNTAQYNRGGFSAAPGNHDGFHTYTVEWTSTQVVWQLDGQTVRVLTPETADSNQYPETPMMVKVGVWAGGDPSNSPGTIQWAGGVTDYAGGPYTMYMKSLSVTDYSTGTSYSYGDHSGSWQSIVSNGGQINGNIGGASASVATGPTVTSTVGTAPLPFSGTHKETSSYSTPSTWPWVPTTLASTTSATTTSVSNSLTVSGASSGPQSTSVSSTSSSDSSSSGAENTTVATSVAAQAQSSTNTAHAAPSTGAANSMYTMPAGIGAFCALLGSSFAFF
jgi:hypothetical protein